MNPMKHVPMPSGCYPLGVRARGILMEFGDQWRVVESAPVPPGYMSPSIYA
jgi:hypothetical protein